MADRSTDPLLREIEEDLKRDRLEKLWKRFGNWIIGAALALVVGVAAMEGWQGYQQRQRQSATASLYQASQLAETDPQAATERLATVAGGSAKDHRSLALLQQAGLLAKHGDTAAAADVYTRVAGTAGTAALRDLATILGGYALLRGDASPDALDSLRKQLQPRLAATSPWRFSARELEVLIDLQRGERATARQTLSALVADPETPAGIRGRAADMLAQLDRG